MSDPAFATSQDLIAQKKKKNPKNPNTRFPICGDFISPTFQNSNPVFLFLANPFLPYVATPFLPFVRCFFHFFCFLANPFLPYVATPLLPCVRNSILFFSSGRPQGRRAGSGRSSHSAPRRSGRCTLVSSRRPQRETNKSDSRRPFLPHVGPRFCHISGFHCRPPPP